jgi:hypothetical protein
MPRSPRRFRPGVQGGRSETTRHDGSTSRSPADPSWQERATRPRSKTPVLMGTAGTQPSFFRKPYYISSQKWSQREPKTGTHGTRRAIAALGAAGRLGAAEVETLLTESVRPAQQTQPLRPQRHLIERYGLAAAQTPLPPDITARKNQPQAQYKGFRPDDRSVRGVVVRRAFGEPRIPCLLWARRTPSPRARLGHTVE